MAASVNIRQQAPAVACSVHFDGSISSSDSEEGDLFRWTKNAKCAFPADGAREVVPHRPTGATGGFGLARICLSCTRKLAVGHSSSRQTYPVLHQHYQPRLKVEDRQITCGGPNP